MEVETKRRQTRNGSRTLSSRASSSSTNREVDWARRMKPSPDLRSTGFHPVYMSPSARYDIVDHMNSHYRRLGSAKATVDTSPPKSYLMSKRTPSPGASTRSTSRASSASRRSVDRRRDDDDDERSAIVRTSTRINYYLDALRREQQRLLTQVGSEKAYYRRRQLSSSSNDHVHRRPRPDLLDRHAELFTSSNRPFVPRLLRTPATSRLPEYRWYNPPKMKSTLKSSLNRKSNSDFSGGGNGEDDDRSTTASSKMVATDASERRSRQKLTTTTTTTTTTTDDEEDEQEEESETAHSSRSYVINGKQTRRINSGLKRSETKPSAISRDDSGGKETAEEDEPTKYLEFVVDVTNDILVRGIYTNKVLKRVFRNHLDKRKGDLNMDKMERTLQELRKDLGIPDTEDGDGASFGYGREILSNSDIDRFGPTLVNGLSNDNGQMNGTRDVRRSDWPSPTNFKNRTTMNGRMNATTHSTNSQRSGSSGDEMSRGDHLNFEEDHVDEDEEEEEARRRLEDLLIQQDDNEDGPLDDFFEDGDGH